MRYVERNSDGKIVATFAVEQAPGQEAPADDHPDMVEFLRPPVPQTVSVTGLLRALDARGMLEAVDAVVNQADDLMKRLWNRAPFISRNDPMVLTVARFLGMEDQLDDLFREAAVL